MIQTILSLLSLAVSIVGIFVSRARSKKLEDRETAIEAREAKLEQIVGHMDSNDLTKRIPHRFPEGDQL